MRRLGGNAEEIWHGQSGLRKLPAQGRAIAQLIAGRSIGSHRKCHWKFAGHQTINHRVDSAEHRRLQSREFLQEIRPILFFKKIIGQLGGSTGAYIDRRRGATKGRCRQLIPGFQVGQPGFLLRVDFLGIPGHTDMGQPDGIPVALFFPRIRNQIGCRWRPLQQQLFLGQIIANMGAGVHPDIGHMSTGLEFAAEALHQGTARAHEGLD